MSRDHRNLQAFQLSDSLLFMVYDATRKFPREEQYALTAQVRRAALSVPSNIVEGCACRSHLQYLEHLNRAMGPLREARYQMDVARRLGYIAEADWPPLFEQYDHAARVLKKLIQSLTNEK